MSSKLTELTDSSPSAPPPSVLCGSGFLMASNIRRYLWSKKDGPFGNELPVSEGPTPDSTSGYSDLTGSWQRDVARWTNVVGSIPVGGRPIYSSSTVPISRINTEGLVKRIRIIANSPPDPDDEGSDELDSEEPPAKRFQSRLFPSTPRNFQPTLAAIPTSLPHSSPSSSHTRPAINPAVRPSPIQQSRASPIVTSQKVQPEASSSKGRKELLPFPFPSTQVFQ
ncbi:hypothetical protein O181_076868 [Austropuccinia psidii MF-1]|uniref:Uncharacterized protein n=1 Tax=Austropuccinia psidii MF-1 TaxID=1389203 RepID=A0A9Q3FBQ0_9BASI|nr:hypothetical protein [Austropuccinia psidii MF-1]